MSRRQAASNAKAAPAGMSLPAAIPRAPDAAYRGPRTAVRIVRILRHVADHPDGATLTQISVGLSAPKTSLFSLLKALAESGYLVQQDGRYSLGNAAFSLGAAIVARRRFPDVGIPIMRALAVQSGETTFISELASDEPVAVYVARAESSNPIRFMAAIGEKRPLYSSCGGRVLLAHQPREWQEAYFRKIRLVPHTPKTIVNKMELRGLLQKIRETGISRTHEDVHEGVSAFASPIFDRTGQAIAALTLAAPTSRANEGAHRFSLLVKLAAADISEAMGFNGTT